jgi:hypothetical protein
MSQNKKQFVHDNRLKRPQNSEAWKPKPEQKATRKPPKKSTTCINEEENEIMIGKFALWKEIRPANSTECGTPRDQILTTPEPVQQSVKTSISDRTDRSYETPETLGTRREMQTTRAKPPITRSRGKVMSQEPVV